QLQEQFSTLCQVRVSPSTVRGGQDTSVTVSYTDAKSFSQNIPVTCGNGQTAQATCTGDAAQGSCTATCAYADELPYPREQSVSASVSGQSCNPTTVRLVAPLSDTGNFVGRITSCSDGSAIANAELRLSQPQFSISTNFTGDGIQFMDAGQSVRLSNGYIVTVDAVTANNATLSFLNAEGQNAQQNTLSINQTAAISQAIATLLNVTGTTAKIDARALTAGTPYLQTSFYSDDSSQAKVQLNPGSYTVQVFKQGYNLTSATFTVRRAESTTQGICLESRACDFGVELLSAPTCSLNSDQYQLRVSNTQNVTKNVTLTYSSSEINGPALVTLAPNQATLVSLTARSASPALSGQSLGIVNVVGPDACTQSFTLPLCIDQKVVVQAPQDRVSTAPGKTVCTTILVKNRALQNVRVALSGQSNVASLSHQFSPQNFMLSSLEVKNVQLCATPQSGASGSATLNIFADSPFGQSNATLNVDTFGQGFFSSDFAGCPLLDADKNTLYALNVQNTGEDGDYLLVLDDNELSGRNEYVIQQFQKDATRTVSLQLEPQGTTAGRHLIDYFLKKDGQTVFQDQLCFDVRGTSVAEARVQPNPLDVPKGQTRSAMMFVH
ncbi:MAG: hypothetical protein Q8P02_03095, partial [Candidatus Micrarchaeota archaeon]|nr:hypothetical protein [Candidatus Micrarchaeota archaeon]